MLVWNPAFASKNDASWRKTPMCDGFFTKIVLTYYNEGSILDWVGAICTKKKLFPAGRSYFILLSRATGNNLFFTVGLSNNDAMSGACQKTCNHAILFPENIPGKHNIFPDFTTETYGIFLALIFLYASWYIQQNDGEYGTVMFN